MARNITPPLPYTAGFQLPNGHYLLVSTPHRICAWDATGLSTVFESSKGGIVAVRSADNDSGVLAIADRHVVVLHDTRRGQERSWGLTGDDEVRHLEYIQDSQCLYMSTRLTNEVQRYSTATSRLLSPAQTLNSAPTALAVNCTGLLMVSALDNPPCVYLKDIKFKSEFLSIQPQASQAAVSVAAFHSESPDVFLLAFKDGTMAAYDASRITRHHLTNASPSNGEIGRITGLHRTTSNFVSRNGITAKSASISDAAFLPRSMTKAVSVGSDGRCRVVDFADGGSVLQTWNLKAPLVCLSVLASTPGSRRDRPQSQVVSNADSNIIAIGRADGNVHLYDEQGTLLAQKTVDDNGGRVLGVEWVRGFTPAPIVTGLDPRTPKTEASINVATVRIAPNIVRGPIPLTSPPLPTPTKPHNLGLPSSLRHSERPPIKSHARANTRFVVHPDEMIEGTVRRMPVSDGQKQPALQSGAYIDLFSPVKPTASAPPPPEDKLPVTSPRARPRLSSQTFLKSPGPMPIKSSSSVSKQRNLAILSSTDSGGLHAAGNAKVGTSLRPSSANRTRRQTAARASPMYEDHTAAKATSKTRDVPQPPAANENAKLLAKSRKSSKAGPSP